jgi:hypothetical protein
MCQVRVAFYMRMFFCKLCPQMSILPRMNTWALMWFFSIQRTTCWLLASNNPAVFPDFLKPRSSGCVMEVTCRLSPSPSPCARGQVPGRLRGDQGFTMKLGDIVIFCVWNWGGLVVTTTGWSFGTFGLYICSLVYWECHHPNWRTPTFFGGVAQPREATSSSIRRFFVTVWLSENAVVSHRFTLSSGLKSPVGQWLWGILPHSYCTWRFVLWIQ